MDAVGGGIVGNTEVYRLPDVPEFDVVASVDLIRLEIDPLSIQVEDLAAGVSGQSRQGGPCRAAEKHSGQDACCDQERSFDSLHNFLRFCSVQHIP